MSLPQPGLLTAFTCSYFAIIVHLDTHNHNQTLESLSKYQERRPHSALAFHILWQWARVIGIISVNKYTQQQIGLLCECESAAEGGGGLDLCAVYSRLTQCSTERRRQSEEGKTWFPHFYLFIFSVYFIIQISIYRSTSRTQAAQEGDTQLETNQGNVNREGERERARGVWGHGCVYWTENVFSTKLH